MTIEEIGSFTRKLQSEVQMYDSLTREYTHGNHHVIDLDEVKQWAMRNLESINKALYCLQKWYTVDDYPDKRSRDEAIN